MHEFPSDDEMMRRSYQYMTYSYFKLDIKYNKPPIVEIYLPPGLVLFTM